MPVYFVRFKEQVEDEKGREVFVKGLLGKYLERVGGDYSDIRYERMERTRIEYRGHDLLEAGSSVTGGFVLRLLERGGFASACFAVPSDLDFAVRRVRECAKSMAEIGKMKVGLKLPPAVVDEVMPCLEGDPREVSLEEKNAALGSYNRLVMASKDMATTSAVYEEVTRERHFVNSEGSSFSEPLVTVSISVRMIAARDGLLQNGRAVVGGSDGFRRLLGREDVFAGKAEIVSKLLDARPVETGTYNVVLNPEMTGVFIHEAFGHFSEADLIERNPSLRGKMSMGKRLGSDLLTIYDDPAMPGQIGHYSYDDEGVAGRRVVLMQGGILRGRLHSMQTAFSYGEDLTGHAVAEDFRYAPIVRMGCIHLSPGENALEELLSRAGEGLYVLDAKGGQTSGENFTFGAQYGYLIRDGKPAEMVRDINLMGNLFETLFAVEGVGRETVISEMGGCGKGQMNIRSAMGGPHILIKAVRVGGA